ncbi:HAD hydrolase family protein [Paenibacillus antibioticophila]
MQKLGIVAGSYTAFGNDANDISMFQHARSSVCVGEHAALQNVATECVSSD